MGLLTKVIQDELDFRVFMFLFLFGCFCFFPKIGMNCSVMIVARGFDAWSEVLRTFYSGFGVLVVIANAAPARLDQLKEGDVLYCFFLALQ